MGGSRRASHFPALAGLLHRAGQEGSISLCCSLRGVRCGNCFPSALGVKLVHRLALACPCAGLLLGLGGLHFLGGGRFQAGSCRERPLFLCGPTRQLLCCVLLRSTLACRSGRAGMTVLPQPLRWALCRSKLRSRPYRGAKLAIAWRAGLACRCSVTPTQEVEREPETVPAPEPALEPASQEQDAKDLLQNDTELRHAVQRSQLLADVLFRSEAEQQRQVDQYADQLLKQEYQAPSRTPPCEQQRSSCVQCYLQNAQVQCCQ
eukprot:jgi/Astpho2/7505/fgenesh1_pg.00114_%23_94_t